MRAFIRKADSTVFIESGHDELVSKASTEVLNGIGEKTANLLASRKWNIRTVEGLATD